MLKYVLFGFVGYVQDLFGVMLNFASFTMVLACVLKKSIVFHWVFFGASLVFFGYALGLLVSHWIYWFSLRAYMFFWFYNGYPRVSFVFLPVFHWF